VNKTVTGGSLTVLSVDPGLQRTGLAVLNQANGSIRPLLYECIETGSKTPLHLRLLSIYDRLKAVIGDFHPSTLAIEKQYFPLKLSSGSALFATNQARGVVLLIAAQSGLNVVEYSPQYIKIALTGYGRADKIQVLNMVKLLLNIKEINGPDDISDAIAVGLCHLHSTR
jgi:crossover junction endodeoxyribonuclease RuvC